MKTLSKKFIFSILALILWSLGCFVVFRDALAESYLHGITTIAGFFIISNGRDKIKEDQ